MRTVAMLISVALGTLLITGCKSSPVSRTYSADYDQVWQAALTAAKNLTGQDPVTADKDSGKIITAWTQGTVNIQEGQSSGEKRSVDIWRGIVNVQKDIAGVKVTVRTEKGNYAAQQSPSVGGAQDASLNVSLWSTDKDPQKMYLNQVTSELVKIKYRNKK